MRRILVPGIPFAVSLALSSFTLGTHAAWQDSGLFLAAIRDLGVLYPPGFVLYEVLCHAWTRVFFFLDFVLAVHLFSALCAAGAAAVTALATRDLLRCRAGVLRVFEGEPGAVEDACAALAGTLLATGYTFASSATLAKGYAFYYLVLSLLIWRMIRAAESGRPRDFTIVAALIGASAQAHPSSALTGAALLLFVGAHARALGWKGVAGRTALAAAVALGPSLLLLPWLVSRDAAVQMGRPTGVAEVLRYVTGGRFVGKEGAFGIEASRLGSFTSYFWEEMLGVGTLLVLGGLLTLARRDAKVLVGMLLWLVPYAAVAVFFRNEGQHDYWFVAAWMPLYLAAGVAAFDLSRNLGARALPATAAIGVLATAWAVGANFRDLNRRHDGLAEAFGRTFLAGADARAVLVLDGDDPNALALFLQRVRGERADVAVVTAPFLVSRPEGGRDWYYGVLTRRHPDLRRPPVPGEAPDPIDEEEAEIARFINSNLEIGRPIFCSREISPRLLQRGWSMIPAGAIWKLERRGALPDLKYWTLPVEPEAVAGRMGRPRGQRRVLTPQGEELRPQAYEERLLAVLIRARLSKARLLLSQGDGAGAAALGESILSLEEGSRRDVDLLDLVSLAWIKAGDDVKADAALKREAESTTGPFQAKAILLRGDLARRRKDEPAARALYLQALAVPGLDPGQRGELEARLRAK